jgi:hypothetical protein
MAAKLGVGSTGQGLGRMTGNPARLLRLSENRLGPKGEGSIRRFVALGQSSRPRLLTQAKTPFSPEFFGFELNITDIIGRCRPA